MAAPNGPPTAEPELAEANGGSEPEAPAAAGPRWILVWIADAAEPEQPLQIAFRAGAVHEIAVAIGPNQEGAIAAVGGRPFDEELGAVADMEELTVTFLAPVDLDAAERIDLPAAHGHEQARDVRGQAAGRPRALRRRDPGAPQEPHRPDGQAERAVLADPAQAPPGSRIELEVATIVPETVDLGSREGADAGIVRTGAGTTANRRPGAHRLRRRPDRPCRPGRESCSTS